MQKILDSNRNNGSFNVEKINLNSNFQTDNTDIKQTDKIKIIELCNIVDKWEEEVLFSENGFYSLQGKEVTGKRNEFIKELEKFINSKVNEMEFNDILSKEIVYEIKAKKISAISYKMQAYEDKELKNWELSVYNDAINSAINRAILYKSDNEVVLSSYNKGLSIIDILAEKENWSTKTLKKKKEIYRSEFYYSVIKAFMSEKDIEAYKYFERNKEFLQIEDKDKLEKSLNKMKDNIIAYNWAQEIFSYNLSEEEIQKHLNSIKEENIKKSAKSFLKNLEFRKQQQIDNKKKEDNEKNWQEITDACLNTPDTAELYIDYTLDDDHIKSVEKYIKDIKNNGFIVTDKEKFFEIISEIFKDFNKYLQKDISKYRAFLSEEDYKLIESFQQLEKSEYENLYLDYIYVIKKLKNANISQVEDKYNCVKTLIFSLKDYKNQHNKNPDIETKNKIIDSVLERFEQKEINVKKEGKVNDSIIGKSGK